MNMYVIFFLRIIFYVISIYLFIEIFFYFMYIVFRKIICEIDNQKRVILSVVECWWEYLVDLEQCEYSVLRSAYWTEGYISDIILFRGLKCLLVRLKILGDRVYICNIKLWYCISVGVSGMGCLQVLLYTFMFIIYYVLFFDK